MGRSFRSSEYPSLEKLLAAIESWIELTEDYNKEDFIVFIRKAEEWEK